jgi:hypothetical protein
MNLPLIKGVIASIPVTAIFWYAMTVFAQRRSVWGAVQLTGAAGLVIVIVAHVCEALHLLPWFGWGQEHSVGHYIDLSGAVLGLVLPPVGYLLRRRQRQERAS